MVQLVQKARLDDLHASLAATVFSGGTCGHTWSCMRLRARPTDIQEGGRHTLCSPAALPACCKVRLASHWTTWLEVGHCDITDPCAFWPPRLIRKQVTKVCSGSGSQPSILAVDALHPASSARASEAARDGTATVSVARVPGPVQRVRRFSPRDDEAVA